MARHSFGKRGQPRKPKDPMRYDLADFELLEIGALREMRRVARPGALLGVLEFALPESGLLAPVARAFVSVVVPVLGAVLSGARFDEYAHLARSIAEFPSPDKFRERIAAAGFEVGRG